MYPQGYGVIVPAAEPREEIDKPLGFGGFGVIWSVTDPRDNKRKALKRITNIFHSAASSRRAFREICMLAAFSHENVLALEDIVYPEHNLFNEIYILMELMTTDLSKIIASSTHVISEEHIQLYVYQILRGLKYLHSAGVIHRDLKPNNLLVNNNSCLKICDFGLSRVYNPNDNAYMTVQMVTEFYRPPEIILGSPRYSSALDIWSAGCIFAELFQRKVFFPAKNPMNHLDMIMRLVGTPTSQDMLSACEGAFRITNLPYYPNNFSRLYQLSPLVNQDTVFLLSRMLTFNPKKRITAAEALAHRYVKKARARFHGYICSCCKTISWSGQRKCALDLEPDSPVPFNYEFDSHVVSVEKGRESILSFIQRYLKEHKERTPLLLNRKFVNLGHFLSDVRSRKPLNLLPPVGAVPLGMPLAPSLPFGY